MGKEEKGETININNTFLFYLIEINNTFPHLSFIVTTLAPIEFLPFIKS